MSRKMFSLFLIFSFLFSTVIFCWANNNESQVLIKEGMKLYSQGKIDSAEKKLKQALSLSDEKWIIYNKLGKIMYLTENYSKAGTYFDKSIRSNANNPTAYFNKGLIHYDQNQRVQAIENFQKARSLFLRNNNLEKAKQTEAYMRLIDCGVSIK